MPFFLTKIYLADITGPFVADILEALELYELFFIVEMDFEPSNSEISEAEEVRRCEIIFFVLLMCVPEEIALPMLVHFQENWYRKPNLSSTFSVQKPMRDVINSKIYNIMRMILLSRVINKGG